MRDDYLLVLQGHNILREIELDAGTSQVRVGTTARCDVRFRKELFFAPFELDFEQLPDGVWELACSEGVYLGGGGMQKRTITRLAHGDELYVRYATTDATLFSLSFAIDFERERGGYDRWVDLSGVEALSIGSMPRCNLVLSSPYTEGDLLVLQRTQQGLVLAEERSRYGILCDGERMHGQVPLANRTFFSVANFYFYYAGNRLYFSRTASISFNGVAVHDKHQQVAYSEYPLFNRSTRLKQVLNEDPIPILDPPEKPQKQDINIIMRLMPALGSLLICVLLRGSLGGSSSYIIISAASTTLGILTSLLSFREDKRTFAAKTKEREESYNAYIAGKREEIEQIRAEELKVLGAVYPSAAEELAMVRDFDGRLFERRALDEDFLHVRLGLGARESVRQVDHQPRETFVEDELAELPEAVRAEYRYLPQAPITVDLAASGAIGLVGPESKTDALVKSMVVDLVTRQDASELRLVFVAEPEHADALHWARMLPHVQNDELRCRNIACGEESKNALFEYLYSVLAGRSQASRRDDTVQLPRYVAFFIDECGIKNHPLCKFIDDAAGLGMTFVFVERLKERLPLGCTHVITLEGDSSQGVLVDAGDAAKVSAFAYEVLTLAQVEGAATTLAPVHCEEVSLEGELTKNITLFELLGIMAADDLDLGARWASSQVYRSMSAPIGVSKTRVVDLDLHDKAHGPHGLVAGTTGSGKSEALQTYILSMATLYHPYEVGFMIIDFKGGGMVNQFRDLPHLMGAITNIDGREINRSLKSIKAELQKRQRLFAEAGVNHIDAYIRKYRAHEVAEPLPHLIMIVDEFAELKAEQPEFMKELISASRIGRSLGVHLILATQKPAGQVSEQIWSNSRFKLCLKVASVQDSNEVLKSPLAAEIKEAGRAYLQVGNNEIFELLQSAYSGAPEHQDEDTVHEFKLYEVDTAGHRQLIYQRKRPKAEGSATTQLEALVAHVAGYCEGAGIMRLPSICLPPLPERVEFPEQVTLDAGGLGLGLYDDPDTQYQGEVKLDVENSNVFILGAAQTGKTNLLQAIVRGVASERTPRQAVFYIMDFGSMVLKNLEGLGHVGGVVLASEPERVKNLFKLLGEELAERRKKLVAAGVSSFAAYLEAGNTDLPHVYVMLDNFAVFREMYQATYEGDLLSLCRDGLTYGVTVIVTNASTSGFGFKYLSNFSTCIGLQVNETAEYTTIFGRCRMEPKAVGGRALCQIEKNLYEFQSYLAFAGEREVDRVAAMRRFVAEANARCAGQRARRIPSVPDALSLAYIRENYRLAPDELALALSYGTVEPAHISLAGQFSLCVVGRDARQRESVAAAVLADLRGQIFERPAEVTIVDGMDRALRRWEDEPFVAGYYADYTEANIVLEDFNERLEARYETVMEEGMEALADEPYLVAIINSAEAVAHIQGSREHVALYQNMAKKYAALRVFFVFCGLSDTTVPVTGAPLLKDFKQERHGIVFSALPEVKFYEVNPSLARANKERLDEGQAYLFDGTDISKIKIAR